MAFRVIFVMISLIICFNIITDWYFYKRAIMRFFNYKWLKITHWSISAIFVALNLFIAYKFTSPNTDPTSNTYIWTMLFYFIAYLPKVLFIGISWPELFLKKTKFFSYAGLFLGILASLCYIWGAAFGRFDFAVNRVDIPSDHLPKTFKGYKIVQFSDTHLGNFGHSDRIVRELVERINAEHPDLIVFTGDLVNTRAHEIDRFAPLLMQLKAKDGVYSILGNHDYGDYVYWKNEQDHKSDFDTLLSKQQQLGWKLLRNETQFITREGDSIQITGVENWGEPPFHQYGDLAKATRDVHFNGFKLLLSHNPEHWRQIVVPGYDFDLTLSGHTHAMQMAINLFGERFSPAVMKYRNWGGLYTQNNKSIYVNEGIGYVLYPMRLGSGPEISVLTLR